MMNILDKIIIGSVIFFTSVNPVAHSELWLFDYTEHGKYDYFESLDCMALNVYNEARGEPFIGKSAVAWVVMNRVDDSRYYDSPCEVIYAGDMVKTWKGNWVHVRNRCSFAWVCDGNPDNDVPIINNSIDQRNWDDSLIAAKYALDRVSEDPTGGATHYYNHNLVQPNWGYPVTRVLTNHTFTKKP